MEDLLLHIQTIFQDVFDNPDLRITSQSSARDVPGWDSLTTINLIFAMEREFKIRFALGEIQDLNNVGEMAALIETKRSAS